MGSKTRFDYTMLGDQVNLAARLEGINKQFGTYTMISARDGGEDRRGLPRAGALPRGGGGPQGAGHRLRADAPRGVRGAPAGPGDASPRALKEYYAGRFMEAGRIFKASPPRTRPPPLCEEMPAPGRSPPEEGWNGVWVMTEK